MVDLRLNPDHLKQASRSTLVSMLAEYQSAYRFLDASAVPEAVSVRKSIQRTMRRIEREIRRRDSATDLVEALPSFSSSRVSA